MKIVAEIGLSHEGSLGTALRMIDACADAGADAVKFQNHWKDACDTFRPGTWFPQDKTRQDYWQRTYLDSFQFRDIRERCHLRGLELGASCFSVDAVRLMAECHVDFFKVGSAQVSDERIIRASTVGRKPLVISSGMSSMDEIRQAVRWAERSNDITLLQCVSAYPAAPEQIGLNVMEKLKPFGCKVGLSDHSGTIWPGIVAAYLGADMLEVHVCQSRWSFGPDVPASLTFDELKQLVAGVRFVERMTPVDKDEAAKSMDEMRQIFREATNA